MLEVAARPIGGLCARALRFVKPGEPSIGLEQLLLRHAVGEPVGEWLRESEASAVMMIPIPRSGVFRGAAGVDEAKAVAGVDEVLITAKWTSICWRYPRGRAISGSSSRMRRHPTARSRQCAARTPACA